VRRPREAGEGRLEARPQAASAPAEIEPPGLRELAGGALLRVPPALAAPAPLVVLLHGAGGDAAGGLRPLAALADDARLVLLAPQARGRTWDLLEGGLGPDAARLDALLAEVFARVAIDPGRLALGGFSDGASYALSLGPANGDLFTHLVAFSPGFAAPPAARGEPAIFVSHGTQDAVLPIERCSRRLVPALRRAGYAVAYEEFDGGHTVPPSVVQDAVAWLGAG